MAGVEQDLAFSCTCGTLTGTMLETGPSTGVRLDCFCSSCRAAEVYTQNPDPSPAGVALFQTTPDRVRFDTGLDNLAAFEISKSGPLRWYAKCCGATLFNTLRTQKIAFAALRVDRLEDPKSLGSVRARAFVRQTNGTTKHENARLIYWNLLQSAGPRLINGRWRITPFFDPETRQPVRDVHRLTKAERSALPLR